MIKNEGNQMTAQNFNEVCYGCAPKDFVESVAESVCGPNMAVLSILSDAQALLERGQYDESRKMMNKAKLVVASMLKEIGGTPREGWEINYEMV